MPKPSKKSDLISKPMTVTVWGTDDKVPLINEHHLSELYDWDTGEPIWRYRIKGDVDNIKSLVLTFYHGDKISHSVQLGAQDALSFLYSL